MLIVTTEKVEGKKISKVLGLVRGSTIRAKHVGKDIGASLRILLEENLLDIMKCSLKQDKLP